MTIKAGVIYKDMHEEIRAVVAKVDAVFYLFGLQAICTSARDGKHQTGSLHYEGRALDLRSHHVPDHQQAALLTKLRESLGPNYDVLLEKDHYHLEYDPKVVLEATNGA